MNRLLPHPLFPARLRTRLSTRLVNTALILFLGAAPNLSPTAAAQIPGGAIIDSLITVPGVPPERVTIDYIFFAFDGSINSRQIGRTRFEADSLARAILNAARAGADFDSLKKADSDEPRLKPMTLVNKGLRPAAGERTRKMVEIAVGDMAFGMSPGDIGLVVPNNTTCRYGYYVVRRNDPRSGAPSQPPRE